MTAMTRGKYANAATHRRREALQAELAQARADLAEARTRHHEEAEALKTELRKLRGEILSEAQRLASSELEKRMREAEEDRKHRGISDDMINSWQYRQDRFIMNACRYLCMAEGENPLQALGKVWTWLTDEDSYGAWQSPVKLAALGLPSDGWVTWALRQQPHQGARARIAKKHRQQADVPVACTLDRAEREGFSNIHPDYKKWARYFKVDYRATVMLDDGDGNVEEIIT